MHIFNNVCEMIGNTPIVCLNKIKKDFEIGNNIYAKIEKSNPGGSIKDRIAYNMVSEGIKKGLIKDNSIIVEATSGNTGIGLAMVCAYFDLKLVIFMCDNASLERIKTIEFYGGKVVLTPNELGINGAVNECLKFVESNKDCIYINQFSNEFNPLTHFEKTAIELYNDLDGNIDIVFCGIGSGGTITGIGKKLKNLKPSIKVIGIEPFSSPFFTKGITGTSDIPGIGSLFKPDVLCLDVIDEIVCVKGEDARYYEKQIALKEGLFVGISSGACFSGMVDYLRKNNFVGKNIILIFPDSGDRYLSLL